MPEQNFSFFLGGHDLEMIVIKDLLIQNGYKEKVDLFDNCLTWENSEWKQYANEIAESSALNKTIVGIELRETGDYKKKPEWLDIDHHNANINNPTSLEQLANLINVSLDMRYYQLVIANDKAHIKGLHKIEATQEEIHSIRSKDRKAQGVTPEEEDLAKNDIKRAIIEHGVTIIHTILNHFSPVTDQVQADKLIVYNDEELCYYGLGANKLIKNSFSDLLLQGQAYYGGDENGYFGIVKSKGKQAFLDSVKEKIILILTKEDAISHHVFMYPFQWDFFKREIPVEQLYFDERTDMKSWKELCANGWQEEDFKIGDRLPHNDFNEFFFFYDYVRKTLYNDKSDNIVSENSSNLKRPKESKDRMLFYNYHQLKHSAAYFKIKMYGTEEPYDLKISDINLHIFDTGIGILTFNLFSTDTSYTSEDILKINNAGRRIYPQFLGDEMTLNAKKAGHAESLELFVGTGKPILEDFSYYNDISKLAKCKLIWLPDYITGMFGTCISQSRDFNKNSIILKNIMDDRMFTICWYGNNIKSWQLKSNNFSQPYKSSPWWYSYVFADNSSSFPSCQNKEEFEKYITSHTYARWSDLGTLYGVTAETFVCLTEDKKTFEGPAIWTHATTIYYQMCILTILQNASILRFANEATLLGDRLHNMDDKLVDEFSILYRGYIEFINKFLFRSVTAQIQGAELYAMLQKHMDIENNAADLRIDMQELHNYMNIAEQKKATDEANQLSRLAAIFLPATFLVSFIAIFTDKEWATSFKSADVFTSITRVILFFIILYVLYRFDKVLLKLFRIEKLFSRYDKFRDKIKK